jgi:hypothetical protein
LSLLQAQASKPSRKAALDVPSASLEVVFSQKRVNWLVVAFPKGPVDWQITVMGLVATSFKRTSTVTALIKLGIHRP